MKAFQEFPSEAGPHPGLELPPGVRVYAVGDVHGRLDLLARMDRMIAADVAASGAERHTVVFLGDYVDRGPQSAEVLESLVSARHANAETVCLKGNHEDFMLDVIDGRKSPVNWLMNGGAATLESYGLDPWSLRRTPDAVGPALRDALPEPHLDFLRRLPTSHRIGGVFFAHAGVDPETHLDAQSDLDLMWVRHKFLGSDRDLGAIVVHGHTPAAAPEVRANRINCDTGAWATNRLTAAVLENGAIRFLRT